MVADGRRRWPQVLLLLVVSTGFGLLAAELAARFWLERFADVEQFRRFASLDQLRQRMEREGQSVSPYAPHRYIGFTPTPGYRRGRNRHNRLGYRGDPIPQPKPEGEFRIVCLGGSTTYGGAVGDPRLAYPAQLEAALRGRGYANVRVVNGGAEGWASHESLVNFEFRVLDLDPDLVIVYHGVNDLNGRMVWPFEAFRGDNSGAVQHSPGLNRAVPLLQQSTLIRILLIRAGRAPSHLALVSNFTVLPQTARFFAFQRQKTKGNYPAGYFERVSIMDMLDRNPPVFFRRNLENLVAVARAQGVQPVLATFAHCDCVADEPALTSEEVKRGIREHNRMILELAESLDVRVYDFAAAFPRDPNLFSSAVHLSVGGNRLKAKLFADFLVDADLLPAPASTGTD
jgi:lysophospholipase L1-like esterase